MTAPVVDLLEVVEVDHHHRQRRAIAARPDQLAFDQLHEVAAIVQPGQHVGLGQMLEPGLAIAQQGDDPRAQRQHQPAEKDRAHGHAHQPGRPGARARRRRVSDVEQVAEVAGLVGDERAGEDDHEQTDAEEGEPLAEQQKADDRPAEKQDPAGAVEPARHAHEQRDGQRVEQHREHLVRAALRRPAAKQQPGHEHDGPDDRGQQREPVDQRRGAPAHRLRQVHPAGDQMAQQREQPHPGQHDGDHEQALVGGRPGQRVDHSPRDRHFPRLAGGTHARRW